ncbi:hypothetical protein EOE48_14360 [Methylobacterium oryzihabitans]|uniref:Uncharacterized protein n=1 Tax=Methylobacterium oryzihabitans TaxID=2499852 RepID=A0A437P497_9HYPH|nr:hypothetical protein EOE48_14360 [Methylobacterium oryzihabitans]
MPALTAWLSDTPGRTSCTCWCSLNLCCMGSVSFVGAGRGIGPGRARRQARRRALRAA